MACKYVIFTAIQAKLLIQDSKQMSGFIMSVWALLYNTCRLFDISIITTDLFMFQWWC